MNAFDMMQHHVFTAEARTTVRYVAIQMTVGRISGLPIVNQDKALIGIVTEFDLIKGLRAGKDLGVTMVADVMTSDVITVDAEATIDEVMEVLHPERIIRVPVVSGGRLVGIVSRGDILKAALGTNMNPLERELSLRGSSS